MVGPKPGQRRKVSFWRKAIKPRHEPTMTIDHYVGNYATGSGVVDASMLVGNRSQGVNEKFAAGQQ